MIGKAEYFQVGDVELIRISLKIGNLDTFQQLL